MKKGLLKKLLRRDDNQSLVKNIYWRKGVKKLTNVDCGNSLERDGDNGTITEVTRSKKVSFSFDHDEFEYDDSSFNRPHLIGEYFLHEEGQPTVDNKRSGLYELSERKRSKLSHKYSNEDQVSLNSLDEFKTPSNDFHLQNKSREFYKVMNQSFPVVSSRNYNIISITVPPGRLGIVLVNDKHRNRFCSFISEVRLWSAMYGKVSIGDRLLSINDWDVSELSLERISKIMRRTEKSQRTFILLRINQHHEVKEKIPLHRHSNPMLQ